MGVGVGEAGKDPAAAGVHALGVGTPRQHLGARPQRADSTVLDEERGLVEDRAGLVAGDDRGVVEDDRRAHAFARLTAATGVGNSSGSIGISTIAGLPQANAVLTASATWSGCST